MILQVGDRDKLPLANFMECWKDPSTSNRDHRFPGQLELDSTGIRRFSAHQAFEIIGTAAFTDWSALI